MMNTCEHNDFYKKGIIKSLSCALALFSNIEVQLIIRNTTWKVVNKWMNDIRSWINLPLTVRSSSVVPCVRPFASFPELLMQLLNANLLGEIREQMRAHNAEEYLAAKRHLTNNTITRLRINKLELHDRMGHCRYCCDSRDSIYCLCTFVQTWTCLGTCGRLQTLFTFCWRKGASRKIIHSGTTNIFAITYTRMTPQLFFKYSYMEST